MIHGVRSGDGGGHSPSLDDNVGPSLHGYLPATARFSAPMTTSHAKSSTSHSSRSYTPSATTSCQSSLTWAAWPVRVLRLLEALAARKEESWWRADPEARAAAKDS